MATENRQLPPIPESLINPDKRLIANILFSVMKKKMQRAFGGQFQEMKDDIRKEFGLSEYDARQALLYIIKLSRIACEEIFNELEERLQKP